MFENYLFKKIKLVIDHIEENITERLTLDDLAEFSGISKFYLHKIFKYSTGEKLMDYVRHRKLTVSLNDLLATDLKIIDIANQYNFEYEQSYTRSFKQVFHISPNQYRKERPFVELKEKARLEYLIPISENGIIFEPHIVSRPSFKVVGIPSLIAIEDETSFQEAYRTRTVFLDMIKKVKNCMNKDEYLALVMQHPTEDNMKYYVPCVEVNDMDEKPDGMEFFQIPAYEYVTFRHILNNLDESVWVDWLAIYKYLDGWLEDTPYKRWSRATFFEKADISFTRSDFGEFELFVPIQRKSP